jgi:hypothetical protein
VWRLCINTIIVFLDIIQRFFFKHSVSETGFCLRHRVKAYTVWRWLMSRNTITGFLECVQILREQCSVSIRSWDSFVNSAGLPPLFIVVSDGLILFFRSLKHHLPSVSFQPVSFSPSVSIATFLSFSDLLALLIVHYSASNLTFELMPLADMEDWESVRIYVDTCRELYRRKGICDVYFVLERMPCLTYSWRDTVVLFRAIYFFEAFFS